MDYRNLKNPIVMKIVENAIKFDNDLLKNEEVVKILLKKEKMELNEDEQKLLEEIFEKLHLAKDNIQLSKN
ncbi:acetyltransferase [Campylobacter sp. RM12327]|uniref:hypothetical protein n=1 Tax=Campylobacter sputorum TaxID=206 RepID=UPI00053BF588|nr:MULTISPECIES: hypothetical protein [Campylobacter]ASM40130.1 hypothetical protein CSPB_0913 [Campylobacter sputorum]MBE7358574.1 acetyltransferase [Campylobacter sp. RM11302]MBF6669916.1 acetyltransferase [Campylobacter sp. RM12327]MBF6675236.1 acetyltransferase [Campylobacter sp. RM13538]MBF6676406.1 acetyltransferase [Campylobacter sp. RM12321]